VRTTRCVAISTQAFTSERESVSPARPHSLLMPERAWVDDFLRQLTVFLSGDGRCGPREVVGEVVAQLASEVAVGSSRQERH